MKISKDPFDLCTPAWDPWEILGVSPRSTPREIKTAYRQRVREVHPDVSDRPAHRPDAFVRLRRAYEFLLAQFPDAETISPRTPDDEPQQDGPFSDGAFLFMDIPARSALEGKRIEFTMADEEEFCPKCQGVGHIPHPSQRRCRACGGAGHQTLPWGDEHLRVLCTACGGTGFTNRPACPMCRGRGRISRQRPVALRLPRGCRDGTLLKLPGQGPWRPDRRSRDPLYIEIRLDMPPGLRVDGLHIRSEIPVDLWTALCGGPIPLETIDGEAVCDVPPGSAPGDRVTVTGRGWVDEIGKRGDHIATLRVEFPQTAPPARARKLIHQLSTLWPARDRKPPPALPAPTDQRP